MRFFFLTLLFLSRVFADPNYVLVVGGAGFIGSHVNEMLYRSGYQTVVLDNLSKGDRRSVLHGIFIEGDLSDSALLDQIFSTYPIQAVMHFAAFLDVGESIHKPLMYYRNNVEGTLNLLGAMQRHGVNHFIFSSTCAIFGTAEKEVIDESHPRCPINPYGRSKLMVEQILEDLDRAYAFRYCAFRYFNAAGGDPRGEIKNYQTSRSNLIPVILKSLQEGDGSVTIFGTDYPTPDGTGVRDYVHVEDLGAAHIAAMENLLKGSPSHCYNLGNGHGFSVYEVIAAAERVTGMTIQVIEAPRRAGDPIITIADSKKAHEELHWEPKYPSIDAIIEHAWMALQHP